MFCIDFRVRSKNYQRYYYCVNKRKIIKLEDCKQCSDCKYKNQKRLKVTPLKAKTKKSSRIAKATEIPTKTKRIVWERDRQCCIFCGRPVAISNANAHFIPRSAGGLGIEQNLFTACDYCHREQDNGLNTKEYDLKTENYLKNIYGKDWDKQKLIYKKY